MITIKNPGDFLRRLADNPNVRKAVAVATVSGQPSFLKFFLARGIRQEGSLNSPIRCAPDRPGAGGR